MKIPNPPVYFYPVLIGVAAAIGAGVANIIRIIKSGPNR